MTVFTTASNARLWDQAKGGEIKVVEKDTNELLVQTVCNEAYENKLMFVHLEVRASSYGELTTVLQKKKSFFFIQGFLKKNITAFFFKKMLFFFICISS